MYTCTHKFCSTYNFNATFHSTKRLYFPLTPAYGENELDAPLLLKRVYEKPVEVVTLAEHPCVVRQPEVLCYHEQNAASDGILDGRRNR